VGNLPAVSCASRCELSLASWKEFSFDLNTPPGGAPEGAPLAAPSGAGGVGSAVDVLVDVVFVAAPLEAAPNTVAPTAPPASSEPAIAAVIIPLRMGFMLIVSFR
jgi:hypothetical protein